MNGQTNPTYTYDANGSMTAGANRTATYTASNMTATVSSGGTTMALTYDPDHARSQQVTTTGSSTATTIYFNDAASNVMTERVYPATGSTIWKTYILADGHIVAQRTVQGATTKMRYFILDHLGSVSIITDETGSVITGGRQSYDAWGKERNIDGTPDTTCSLPAQSASTRGFTSQEEMPGVCLINYNARLYDPQIGRFMSADEMVEAPYSTQDWDRYTYVGNNPLSFSDPSGQCFLGCFWKSPIGKAAIEIVIIVVLQQEWALPALLADASVAAESIPFISTVAAAGIAGYVTSGKLNTAIFDAAEAAAFFEADIALKGAEILGNHTAAEFLGHGLVGGIFSVGQKGGFPAGFMAAGFSSLADSVDLHDFYADALVHALAGGVGSILGGGKFANGATTGALQYMAGHIGEIGDDDASNSAAGTNGGQQVATNSVNQADILARVIILGIDYQHTYTDVLEQAADANGNPLKGAYQIKETITPDVGINGNHKPPISIPAGGSFTDHIGWPDPNQQPAKYTNQKLSQHYTIWYNGQEYHPMTEFQHINYYDPKTNDYNNDIKVIHK